MKKLAFYFLFLLVFTIPWQGIVVFPGFGTISRLIGFGSIGIALLLILSYKKISEIPIVIWLMLLFIVWNFLTYFWSIHPPRTFSRIITFTQLLAMVWLIWELCKTKKDGLLIMQAYILGAYVAITDMLLTYFTGQADSFRIAATGFNPNWLAISLAVGIPIAWNLMFKFQSKILYVINMLYPPLALFCVILTASRGGLVAALVGSSIIPISFFLFGRNPKYGIALSIIVVLAFIPLFATDTFSNLEQNIARLTETTDMVLEGRMTGREVIWEAGFKVLRENTVIGVGSGGFNQSIEPILGHARAAHNAYLAVLVDTGIIGFLLFITIIFLAIKPNISLPMDDRLFYVILSMTLLVGFIPANLEANKVTWLVFALLTTRTVYLIRSRKIIQIFK